MSVVLVTGADGFTGRYLCAALAAAGHEVHGLVRQLTGTTVDGATVLHMADLTDSAALLRVVSEVRPERVAHLAAIAFIAQEDIDALYQVNLMGTRNLLLALASQDVAPRSVLIASSANVYGNATAGLIDEDCRPTPANDYAVSKLAMESMAALWLEKLPLTLVRPFNYIGRGQSTDFVVAKIADHIRNRKPVLELGNLDVERDFSDVRVVVDAYQRLLSLSNPPAGPLNICSGKGTTLREVICHLSDIGGYLPELRVNPALIRKNEIKRLVGSATRLESAIGPLQQIPLRETLTWILS